MMNAEDTITVGKLYGSATVGMRGQLAIPAQARRDLGITHRNKLLVFECLGGRGLLLLKGDMLEQMLSFANKQSRSTASDKQV